VQDNKGGSPPTQSSKELPCLVQIGDRFCAAGRTLEAVARENPDAIILDFGLPDQDGFAVIRHIRSVALTPIIELSVRSDVEGKVRALELGADDMSPSPSTWGSCLRV
jgi:DNA-binding response OmpR family regulator